MTDGIKTIDIVFDGMPGPDEGPHFIEVERGVTSISIGEWVERPDGRCALRIPDPAQFTELQEYIHTLCDLDFEGADSDKLGAWLARLMEVAGVVP